MLKKDFATIDIKEIDTEDDFYSFSLPYSQATELQSYKEQLFYLPILLEQLHTGFRIIEGHHRLKSISQKESIIEAFIYKQANPLNLFIEGILYAKNSRTLNLIESSNIVYKLIHDFKQENETTLKELSLLFLENPNPKQIQLLLSLKNLSHKVSQYVISQNLSLSLASDFGRFSSDEQKLIYKYIDKLKLGVNRVQFLLEALRYISNKNHVDVIDILNRDVFTGFLADHLKPGPHLQKQFIDEVYHLRYPDYKEYMNDIQKVIKSFKLPPEWKISPQKHLERPGFNLNFTIKDQESYNAAVNKLKDILEEGHIKELFNLI